MIVIGKKYKEIIMYMISGGIRKWVGMLKDEDMKDLRMKDGKSIDWKENMNNGKDKWGENIERNKMKKEKIKE